MPRSPNKEDYKDIHFPKAGIDLTMPFAMQPNRPGPDGVWYRTTPYAKNVRSFEATSNRSRGGSRPGLARYVAAPVVADWIIQELNILVRASEAPPVQTSQSGRIVTAIAVSQGDVYSANAGATAWTIATNNTGNTPPLNYTGLMQSTALNQRLWFADGLNWCYYRSDTNAVETWAASAGTLPVDSDGNAPRLIATWRGRIVLSGLLLDPQDWFMSAVGEPTDFDYSPASTSPTQAIAGTVAPQGIVGDMITALIPYTDDILVMGTDHMIWMFRGDPMAGGQIDLISDGIGIAWGQAWCKDPYGNIYFVSNKTGIYTLIPGQQPQRISQAIEQTLQAINTGDNTIRLIWDDRYQGLHVFVTETAAPAAAVHFFFEQRSGAWWYDVFGNTDHNPLCCVTFDGNEPEDRVPLIGSWDGYVRKLDPEATKDDGTKIESEVWIGPITTARFDAIMCKSLQAHLGENSGKVNWAIHVGRTAEAAFGSNAAEGGIWTGGRNNTNMVRREGHAVYNRLTSSVPWSMEAIRMEIDIKDKVRRRGV